MTKFLPSPIDQLHREQIARRVEKEHLAMQLVIRRIIQGGGTVVHGDTETLN